MRSAVALWRLLRAVAHVLHGMVVMRRFPKLDAAGRHGCIRWWSVGLLKSVGMAIEVSGTARPGATLMVANHVSWIDIAAIHAAAPHARFVSKADVLAWPLLGWLIRGAGTLFIERESKRDALRVVHAMAAALQAGDTVAVFPEGTTGAGPELLPFHANLLQAAVAPVRPSSPWCCAMPTAARPSATPWSSWARRRCCRASGAWSRGATCARMCRSCRRWARATPTAVPWPPTCAS